MQIRSDPLLVKMTQTRLNNMRRYIWFSDQTDTICMGCWKCFIFPLFMFRIEYQKSLVNASHPKRGLQTVITALDEPLRWKKMLQSKHLAPSLSSSPMVSWLLPTTKRHFWSQLDVCLAVPRLKLILQVLPLQARESHPCPTESKCLLVCKTTVGQLYGWPILQDCMPWILLQTSHLFVCNTMLCSSSHFLAFTVPPCLCHNYLLSGLHFLVACARLSVSVGWSVSLFFRF